jgi:hypothetical protein
MFSSPLRTTLASLVILLACFASSCSMVPASIIPSALIPKSNPIEAIAPPAGGGSFMAPVTNSTDGQSGSKSASLTLAIAPQLLKSQDEKIVRDGFKTLLQKKGYSECDRDSFCLSEVGVVFSLDPDPSAVYSPYNPSKMICRVSVLDSTTRKEIYKLTTGLLWQSNAEATFQALFGRLDSEMPHS